MAHGYHRNVCTVINGWDADSGGYLLPASGYFKKPARARKMGVSAFFCVILMITISSWSPGDLHVSAAAPDRIGPTGIPGSKVIKETWLWFISMTYIYPRT
jgi:hypothetical protein